MLDVLTLDVIVEELDVRLTEEEQEEIVKAVAEVLGADPAPQEEEGEGEEGEGMEVDGA